MKKSSPEKQQETEPLVTITKSSDWPAIKDFYVSCGKKKFPQQGDDVLVAKDETGKIIGAVRLCHESGVLVLRTMEVSPQTQRQGVGTKLLNAFKDMLGTRECYCIAYAHLDSFYGKIGFKTISFEEVPVFLQERITEYNSKPEAKKFILMKKPAG